MEPRSRARFTRDPFNYSARAIEYNNLERELVVFREKKKKEKKV